MRIRDERTEIRSSMLAAERSSKVNVSPCQSNYKVAGKSLLAFRITGSHGPQSSVSTAVHEGPCSARRETQDSFPHGHAED